ncbi:DMT family transporter [Leeuwenhoekiella aequorea]|uniref:DMT family transporter n=1 Tax=Leeuwenhoekiella aequorea TaxID=283736 RepID=UPI00352D24CC
MQNDSLKSYLHFHFIVFIWGFTAVLGALISIDTVALVWYRMLIASLFIYIYIRYKKIPLGASKSTRLKLAGAGIIIALHWLTFFGAIKLANVSITLAMLSTGAFFTSILEPIFYKRKVIWYEIVFGLFVIAGLYLIFEVETRYTEGIIVALISALLSAIFTLINGKFVQQHHPVMISFYELLTGALFITVFLAVTARFDAEFFNLNQSDWIYILILATICTAYAFIAAIKVMKYLSPYTVMLTTNMEPVYGIILAYVILGDTEEMNTGFYYGAVLILLTVIGNGILKSQRKWRTARQLKKQVK